MFACLSKKHNFDIESVIFGCHFCAQTLRNLKQSSILSFDLPETWNTRHFCEFGRQKRETVVKFAGLIVRSVKQSSLLRPRASETWNSRQMCGLGLPKRETLVIPAAPCHLWHSKSLLFKRILIKNRYFSVSRPLPASPGTQNHDFFKEI